MIVLAVHLAALQPGDAFDHQSVGGFLRAPAERPQHLRNGAEPVALLEPQPRRARDARDPRPHRRRHGQRGHQIRRVGRVDLAAQLVEQAADRAVALRGILAQPFAGDLAAQPVRGQPERRRRPVALGTNLAGAGVALPARNRPALRRAVDADAEAREHVQRDAHIGRRRERRGQPKRAVLPAQRQREQQPRDVLRADVAGDFVVPAAQLAAEADRQAVAVRADAMRVQRAGERRIRPLRQPPRAGKRAGDAERRRHGQQKPQRRAALAAEQLGHWTNAVMGGQIGQNGSV